VTTLAVSLTPQKNVVLWDCHAMMPDTAKQTASVATMGHPMRKNDPGFGIGSRAMVANIVNVPHGRRRTQR
jgi:hypothetical protein